MFEVHVVGSRPLSDGLFFSAHVANTRSAWKLSMIFTYRIIEKNHMSVTWRCNTQVISEREPKTTEQHKIKVSHSSLLLYVFLLLCVHKNCTIYTISLCCLLLSIILSHYMIKAVDYKESTSAQTKQDEVIVGKSGKDFNRLFKGAFKWCCIKGLDIRGYPQELL